MQYYILFYLFTVYYIDSMTDWLFSKSKDILLLLESGEKNLKQIQQNLGGSFSTIEKYINLLNRYDLITEKKEPNRTKNGRIVVGFSRVFSLTNKGKEIAKRLHEIDQKLLEIKRIMEEKEKRR